MTGPRRTSQSSRTAVLVVMCVGYFLVLLDVTIVNVALPRIGSELSAGVTGLQWVVDGYAVALASLMLASGAVGDLYGHKRVVLGGLALFGIASLGCGLAPGTSVLVGFRALQGVGAALMQPGTLAVITRAYPDRRERAAAVGLWAGIGSAALAAGPLLGGLLVETAGWRSVFLLNVPVVAVALWLAARMVVESIDRAAHRLDGWGALLAAVLLATVTFAFIEGGHGGFGPGVVAVAVVGLGSAIALFVVERSRERPMLPLGLFRRPVFAASNAVAGVMNLLCTLGLLFVLTLYLQETHHYSPLQAGLALFGLFLPLSVLAPLGGRITARLGPRWPMAAGAFSAGVGVALLTRLTPDSGYLTMLPALLLWGVGLAVLTPAVVAAAVGAVPPERAGLASAVNNTARQASGAVGIAAFGAVAGPPAGPGFVTGFHLAAVVAAGLFLGGAATAVGLVRA